MKDDNDEDKKAKSTKKCIIKEKLKFEDYKNCLESAQTKSKISHLQKNKIAVDSPKELKKIISKTQQRFKKRKAECCY